MQRQEGKYNIKAVSQLIGVQSGTIRAWERRYKIFEPLRNEAGHRLYTDENVRVLKWLAEKVNQGITISQAVALLETDEKRLEREWLPQKKEDKMAPLQNQLYEALMAFDEQGAQNILNKAMMMYSVDKVVHDLVSPLLWKIGDSWGNGEITVAHEHFATAFLRSKIGNILQLYPINGFLPKAVAICGFGEKHEFGILIFALFLKQLGFKVIYLGTSIPKEDLHVVLKQLSPKFLFISCTMSEHIEETLQFVHELSNKLKVQVGLGGRAFLSASHEIKEKYDAYLLGQTTDEWKKWLMHYMGDENIKNI